VGDVVYVPTMFRITAKLPDAEKRSRPLFTVAVELLEISTFSRTLCCADQVMMFWAVEYPL
jgi:hypothetical protein